MIFGGRAKNFLRMNSSFSTKPMLRNPSTSNSGTGSHLEQNSSLELGQLARRFKDNSTDETELKMENKDLVDLIAPRGESLTYPSIGQACYEELQKFFLSEYKEGSYAYAFWEMDWGELSESEHVGFENAGNKVLNLVVLAAASYLENRI